MADLMARRDTARFPPHTRALVVTVSDRCSRGQQVDASGPAVARMLEDAGAEVVEVAIVADEVDEIEALLRRGVGRVHLIATTGGTGLAPRDVTPEATRRVSERLVEGVAERMRADGLRHTPFAALSRGVCGTAGTTLILNLPGSPGGACSSLRAVLELLPHAIDLLAGRTAH